MNMKKKRFILMLFSIVMAINCFSQAKEFQGTVLDNHGDPVIGASVLEKGTSNGTVTDIDGMFRIKVEEGAVFYVDFLTFHVV